MPHLYPFLSSKRPYLQLFQQLQTLLYDKKESHISFFRNLTKYFPLNKFPYILKIT